LTDKHVVEGVVKVKVMAGTKFGDFAMMETRLYDTEGEYIRNKNISVNDLKAKGVVSRWNSFGKAEKWLNTEEGLTWISTAKHISSM
jgi:hypothetical protein